MNEQLKIKEIIDGMGRLRAATLHKKFTAEQQAIINAWPSDEEFKVKALRVSGLGKCKKCNSSTGYVEKMRFYEYCSKECEINNKRAGKLDNLYLELEEFKLTLSKIPEAYTDIEQELHLKCEFGHDFTSSIKMLRHRTKGCKVCEVNQRTEIKETVREEKRIAYKEARSAKARVATQQRIEDKNKRLAGIVGSPSNTQCKSCGKFTKYYLIGTRKYAPKFCNDTCKSNFSKKGFEDRLDNLKLLLDPTKHEHVSIITTNRHDVQHLIRFKDCNHEYPVILRNIARPADGTYNTGLCPDCTRWTSGTAQKILDKLNEAKLNVIQNNRSILANNREIDLYLPDHKLGIEVNGIWWHSSIYKSDTYHLEKTLAAKEANVRLLHLFSDEIDGKFDIIMSLILQKIGKSNKIHARKCQVVEIDSTTGREFLDKTHLQGKCNAKVYVGLKYENQLVAVMSFRKPFAKSASEWEIARFSTQLNTTVVGGATKLLRYFERNHDGSIMTFSDERYTTGQVYEKMGFTLSHITKPGYSYVVNGKREHRLKYQKHLLTKKGINVEGKTEKEIMIELGYPRIYDSGNKVWIKER